MGYNPLAQGSTFQGSSRSLQTGYINGTASTIPQGTPVSANPLSPGNVLLVDVSNDTSVQAIVGVYAVNCPSTAKGLVLDSGRLENITTSFSVGDAIYINTDGTLMNARPQIGTTFGGAPAFAAGDYVIFIGVIVQNEFTGGLYDLKVYLDVVGVL